ncbi:MAG: mechanosensitive ion channel family protein [Bryobacteraceae bacterium]|nr:mechanosensitive ion channel family protein [Bryobacteraceae bacterium]
MEYLQNIGITVEHGFALVRVSVILVAALIVQWLLRGIIRRIKLNVLEVMRRHSSGSEIEMTKRADTLASIIRKALTTALWFVALMTALRQLGFDLAPILAGAGVAGVALGFGAQSIVKDVISGFFLLIENQIRVNDVCVLNGTGGLVEEINLRTTVLRSLDGIVHIFPNGSITSISNMTREFSFYVFDVGVAYKEDTDKVSQVLREIGAEMQADEEFKDSILEPLEVLGVDKFADSAVIVKARIKTQPIRQWAVGREMNRRIKKRFDELGIEIPFPHMSLYFGEASKPIAITGGAAIDRDELKKTVREVLEEAGIVKPGA